ncbi:MAG: biopolymer transporter ExbD, partial [Spirochaetes bacterium]|nr:biopolymer transporter ExbD [Spirochaetota bacterium]
KIVHVDDIIKVTLTDENNLLYNEKITSLDEIEEIVSNKLKNHPNMTFLLKIHPDTNYQNVVNVLNIVQKLNIENFSFSML